MRRLKEWLGVLSISVLIMDPNSSQCSVESRHWAESTRRGGCFSTVLKIVENEIYTRVTQDTLVQEDTHKHISVNRVYAHSPERQVL